MPDPVPPIADRMAIDATRRRWVLSRLTDEELAADPPDAAESVLLTDAEVIAVKIMAGLAEANYRDYPDDPEAAWLVRQAQSIQAIVSRLLEAMLPVESTEAG